jgi:hypothetical protein
MRTALPGHGRDAHSVGTEDSLLLLPMTRRLVSNAMIEKLAFARKRGANSDNPSMGFGTLRRLQKRAATHTGLASPGCAAPSGFLNLLAL